MYQLKESFKKMDKVSMLFILPSLLIVVLLLIYPIFSSIYFSFTSKNLIKSDYDIVGFENFKFVLSSIEFYEALWVSVKWTILSIVGQLAVGFVAALTLNKLPKFSGLFRVLLIIPWAFPTIVIGFTWKWLLNDVSGFIPNLLTTIGLTNANLDFLSNDMLVFGTVVFINIWFGAPLFMVNILSALQTIPKEQYEAAVMDGANAWQSFTNITLRHIRSVIGLLVVLRTIWVFNNFELLFLITGGGPSGATTTIPIYAYKTGWGLMQLGTASSITILLLIFLISISLIYFKVLDKWESEDR
ncbi:carbohydrate ABC transporter permease [Mammaliicoccus sciuri]|uniref:carbohydrate ABC transporter permease n=1 Tax=Mammaliicoccus sciuri TaxID=1296 RepID=UPI001FB432C7|nr:sugar ABC transporter permease [Mammaliicoccus sciuri]MCJ0925134.1 sugar ABC transporter permease [Mammaliicoccus sciuri]UXV29583.1 sugar ABC transporter permease [Mammaliicoccus sciuri]